MLRLLTVDGVDPRTELRDFLTTRRGRITPAQAGIPPTVGRRRVPGLRRDEVALLAGVSVEYYTRFEQGHARGVSEEVVSGIAAALRLNDTERTHLFDLVRSLGPGARRRRSKPASREIRPGMQTLLDSMTDAAAVLQDEHTNILASNTLGRALYDDLYNQRGREANEPPNHARFIFLDNRSHSFHRDWDSAANNAVALLRASAGKNPFDKALTDLIGELSTRSDDFRHLWAAHDVGRHTTGVKSLYHQSVGDLDLSYEYLSTTADPNLAILVYYAEPGTAAHDGLRLLATVATTDSNHASADHAD